MQQKRSAILLWLRLARLTVWRDVWVLLWDILLLLDVALNILMNGRYEMISTRAARARDDGKRWGCWLCRFLDYVDRDHCVKAKKDPLGTLD